MKLKQLDKSQLICLVKKLLKNNMKGGSETDTDILLGSLMSEILYGASLDSIKASLNMLDGHDYEWTSDSDYEPPLIIAFSAYEPGYSETSTEEEKNNNLKYILNFSKEKNILDKVDSSDRHPLGALIDSNGIPKDIRIAILKIAAPYYNKSVLDTKVETYVGRHVILKTLRELIKDKLGDELIETFF